MSFARRCFVGAVAVLRVVIRFVYHARYGVRGALKPPLGFRPGSNPSLLRRAWYRFRHECWWIESKIYDWTGLPATWHASRF
jgi:hypothetical protein